MTLRKFLLPNILLLTLMLPLNAHDDPAAHMTRAAHTFLASLDASRRDKALLDFASEAREDWHFIPRERAGLSLKEMQPEQRQLAHGLLNSALSHRGYFKAVTIMSLEQILHDFQGQSPIRDPLLYDVAIFGEPGRDRWGWKVEGHHLSVNITIAGGKVIAHAPSFVGANPAEVRQGSREGLRTLPLEEDLARDLAKSLTAEQRETAIIAEAAPRDIITGAQRKVDPLEPLGIGWADLTDTQRETLEKLLREYIDNYRQELAAQDWQKIEQAGMEKLHFAWAGGLEPGEGHYYRVQGEHFLLEYDNTQGGANHIHTVWRDFTNDFGRDLLKEHYDNAPHEHGH